MNYYRRHHSQHHHPHLLPSSGSASSTSPLAGGAVTGGAFLGLNILGFRLWSQRERRRAYVATQLLLAGSSIANAAVILFAQQFNEELRKIGSGTNVSVEVPLVLIFISPVLMLMFFVQERLSRR